MTKRNKTEYVWRNELKKCGWDVHKRDSIAFNSGSETTKHIVCKTLAAKVLKERDYRIDSEVVHPERGEVDIVGYPTVDGLKPIAVECETAPTDDVIQDKLNRYFDGTPFSEVFVINVSDMPVDMLKAKAWVEDQL